jgi:hypothetical protein
VPLDEDQTLLDIEMMDVPVGPDSQGAIAVDEEASFLAPDVVS